MPKQTAIDFFNERYQAVQNEWQQREKDYRNNYRRLLALDSHAGKPHGCKVNTRYVATQVFTHTAFMVSGLLPNYPWVHAECNEPFRDVEPQATEEYNRRLQDMAFYRVLTRWVYLANLYGVGVAKMTWLGELGINVSLLNPADIAWDPKAHNLRYDAEFVIERYDRLTKRMVLALADQGIFDRTAARQAVETPADESESEQADRDSTGRDTPQLTGMDSPIELYDMVTADRIITVHLTSGGGIVLRDNPNPYGRIYYYDMVTFPKAFQVQGDAIPHLLRGIDEEKNTNRRQRTDIRSLESYPMLSVTRSSGLNIYKMRAGPGRVFPVNQQGDVEVLQFRDTGAGLLQEEAVLEQEGDELIGIHAHTRGSRGEQMKATVANLLQQNVNIRLIVSMKESLDYPLRPFFADFVDLCDNYEAPTAVTMAEWAQIRPVGQMKMLRLSPAIEAYVGQEPMKAQSLAQFMAVLAPVTAPEGLGELAKQILMLLQIRDPEKITRWIIGQQEQGAGGQGGAGAGGKADQGRGVAQTGESARGLSPGQPPMALGIPA